MKKLKIFLLTLLMVITLLPVNTLADEDTSSKEPDLSVFATKDDLMTKFTPNSTTGKSDNIAKIKLGRDATNANLIEWYVLGKDDGITNDEGEVIDNTVLFSVDTLYRNQIPFSETDHGPVNYDYKNDEGYVSGYDLNNDSIPVNASHYGASYIRKELAKIFNNTDYFTTKEQKLLNDTKIETMDDRNENNYILKDKLYLLKTNSIFYNNTETLLKIGSVDDEKIIDKSYWLNGKAYWLRREETSGGTESVCFVTPEDSIGYSINAYEPTLPNGIRPATNLNLSNVLFASAAKYDENSKLEANDAMTLRLDGSDRGLGSATVYSDHIEIKNVINVSTTLFIQGKNGNDNWSYRKYIPTDGSVNKVTKTDIINALTSLNITDIDLSKCKVWLETTDLEQRMIYAVEAKQTINRVSINISNPVPGKSLAEEINKSTTDVNYTASSIEWNTTDETAGYYKEYTASVTLTPKTGYAFIDMYIDGSPIKTSASVNGFDATSVTMNTDGTLTVTYKFDPTAKDIFDSIAAMSMEVDSADDINTERFPTEAEVIGKSGIVYKVRVVEWIKNSNNPLEYEGVLAPLPEVLKHNFNDGPATVKLTLTVKPAEVVPPATPEPSTKPTSTSAPVSTPNSVTDDGYVVPNTGVK